MSASELTCMICEREHPAWFAPNDLWNTVMRLPDGSDRYPFTCPTCFAILAEGAGVATIFELRATPVEAQQDAPRDEMLVRWTQRSDGEWEKAGVYFVSKPDAAPEGAEK